MEFDLALNFFVLAAKDALDEQPPTGLIETAPGFRSMLVTYDPFALSSPTSSTTSGPCTTRSTPSAG